MQAKDGLEAMAVGLACRWRPRCVVADDQGEPLNPRRAPASAWRSIGGAAQIVKDRPWSLLEVIRIALRLTTGCANIVPWEDQPHREKADVLALLAAARILEGTSNWGRILDPQQPKAAARAISSFRRRLESAGVEVPV